MPGSRNSRKRASLDVQNRFWSPVSGQHKAAFFEIYLHRLFSRIGFELEAHPDLADRRTHPDYLVRHEGTPVFSLEATITMKSTVEAGERKRENEVYEALDRLESPDFYISVSVQGAPQSPPSGAKPRASLGK